MFLDSNGIAFVLGIVVKAGDLLFVVLTPADYRTIGVIRFYKLSVFEVVASCDQWNGDAWLELHRHEYDMN